MIIFIEFLFLLLLLLILLLLLLLLLLLYDQYISLHYDCLCNDLQRRSWNTENSSIWANKLRESDVYKVEQLLKSKCIDKCLCYMNESRLNPIKFKADYTFLLTEILKSTSSTSNITNLALFLVSGIKVAAGLFLELKSWKILC